MFVSPGESGRIESRIPKIMLKPRQLPVPEKSATPTSAPTFHRHTGASLLSLDVDTAKCSGLHLMV
jgi:hypothetical protein